MSSPNSISITFLDINGEYHEDAKVDTEKSFTLLESPMRILDQYISENFLQDLKKETGDQFLTRYQFSYEMSPNKLISIKCDIIYNFSVSHQSIFDSNGYIVFCNLESDSTYELLTKIMDYIRETCSVNTKTYIIGVFKENIDEDKNYSKMNKFLSRENIEYEYYEAFLGDANNIEIVKKEYEGAEILNETFKNIFKEIYDGGHGPRFSKGFNNKDDAKDKSMGKCLIF